MCVTKCVHNDTNFLYEAYQSLPFRCSVTVFPPANLRESCEKKVENQPDSCEIKTNFVIFVLPSPNGTSQYSIYIYMYMHIYVYIYLYI